MNNYQGGCACRAYRYECQAESVVGFHCHCRACQRASGTGHSSLFALPVSAVSGVGDLKYYDQVADSGALVSRGFCPYCGSPIVCKTSANSAVVILHAASLDDPAAFQPQQSVYCCERQGWDAIDVSLPQKPAG